MQKLYEWNINKDITRGFDNIIQYNKLSEFLKIVMEEGIIKHVIVTQSEYGVATQVVVISEIKI